MLGVAHAKVDQLDLGQPGPAADVTYHTGSSIKKHHQARLKCYSARIHPKPRQV